VRLVLIGDFVTGRHPGGSRIESGRGGGVLQGFERTDFRFAPEWGARAFSGLLREPLDWGCLVSGRIDGGMRTKAERQLATGGGGISLGSRS